MTPESRSEQKPIIRWLANNGLIHVIRNWLKVHIKYRDKMKEMLKGDLNE